jgi:hypothetical protein
MNNTRRGLTYIALSLLCAGTALLGCGTDDSGSDSDASVIDGADGSGGGDDTSGPDSGTGLPPCTDNVDCRGGEVCRDSYCREACGPDDPCAGVLGVCDIDNGVCVGCLDDAQCPGGFCDLEIGVCQAAECDADDDCRGGEACRAGRCVAIDDQVCEPGDARCEGDTLISCSRDGTREDEQVCAAPYRCGLADGVAACVRDICTPDEVGCLDTATAYVCDSTGTARTELPCEDGDVCEAGVCRPGICEGGTARCEGDALVVCDELGTRENAIDCNVTPDCLDTDAGCTCADSECVARICIPGSTECAGSGTRTCNESGLAWETVVACDGASSCIAGVCTDDECEPNDESCAGNTLLRCNSTGSGYAQTDCATSGQTCIESGGAADCATPVCTPGESTCTVDARSRLVCNALGTAQSETACGTGRVCSAGACIDRVCTPGARRCSAGNAEICNTLGTGWALADACGVGEVCVDGSCELDSTGCRSGADCPPPAAFCDGDTYITYVANGACSGGSCDYRGVQSSTDCAAGGQTCSSTGCIGEVECTRDSDCSVLWDSGYCVDNVCVDCRSDENCAANETCVAGTCLPDDAADCTSDAQCVALATELGDAEPDARCRVGYGCYVPGYCNTSSDTTPPDPFDASCPVSLSCTAALSPFSDNGSCSGCASNADCRTGEICTAPILFGGNYCASESSPFPF